MNKICSPIPFSLYELNRTISISLFFPCFPFFFRRRLLLGTVATPAGCAGIFSVSPLLLFVFFFCPSDVGQCNSKGVLLSRSSDKSMMIVSTQRVNSEFERTMILFSFRSPTPFQVKKNNTFPAIRLMLSLWVNALFNRPSLSTSITRTTSHSFLLCATICFPPLYPSDLLMRYAIFRNSNPLKQFTIKKLVVKTPMRIHCFQNFVRISMLSVELFPTFPVPRIYPLLWYVHQTNNQHNPALLF